MIFSTATLTMYFFSFFLSKLTTGNTIKQASSKKNYILICCSMGSLYILGTSLTMGLTFVVSPSPSICSNQKKITEILWHKDLQKYPLQKSSKNLRMIFASQQDVL